MTDLPPTFGEAFARHAAERPSQVALRYEGCVTDYATFDRHATRIANGLIALDLRKGDRALREPNWAGHERRVN